MSATFLGGSSITSTTPVPGTFSEVCSTVYLGASVASRPHPSDHRITGQPVFTTDRFPADLDTTSIGLMVTQPDDHVVQSVLDEMLQYLTGDGITMVNSCHPNPSEPTPVTKPFAADLFRLRKTTYRPHSLPQRPLPLPLQGARARAS